jgi:hypothetical protein
MRRAAELRPAATFRLGAAGARPAEALVVVLRRGLRLGTTFNQGFDNTFRRNFLAATVEDLLLKLSD